MTDTTVFKTKRIKLNSYAVDVHTNDDAVGKKSIVLVHGIGVSGRYFFPFANVLAVNYNVVILDLPGYGKTPKPAKVLSIAELALIVTQLTTTLELDRPIILGHSMGCQIVARAVKKEPNFYQKMILLSPTVNANERNILIQAMRLMQDMMYEPIKAGIIIFADYARMGLRRYMATCRYMLDDKIEQTLKKCPIPVLLVRGQNDVIVPSAWIRQLHDITPSKVCEVADAPHALQLQVPDFLAKICQDFIED